MKKKTKKKQKNDKKQYVAVGSKKEQKVDLRGCANEWYLQNQSV